MFDENNFNLEQDDSVADMNTSSGIESLQESYTPPSPKSEKKFSGVKAVAAVLAICILCSCCGGFGAWITNKYLNGDKSDGGSTTLLSNPTETAEPLATDSSASQSTPSALISGGEVTSVIKTDTTANASAVYASTVNSVVGISTEGTRTNAWGQQSATASSGSGIIISEDGYILTNYHVVEGGSSFAVSLYSGEGYEARLVGYEEDNDIAVLKIDVVGLQPAVFGDSDNLVVGEDVIVIGNPLGELTYTLTRGVVSALNRAINTDGTPINMFQIDAAVNSGNSGGPAFDSGGNVIGIVTAKYSSSSVEGLGFCIPINDAKTIVSELIEYGYIKGKSSLDISVQDIYSPWWSQSRISGAYVSYIASDGCCALAGLNVGDIITAINDTAITSVSDLITAKKAYKAGETATLTIYRNAATFTTQVTLGEYNPSVIPSGWQPSYGSLL